MTDPLRTDRVLEPRELPERDRDARVEQLLLTGLDHYFAGQHELAVSVWTRVLFLDRGHARAKAYIERARGAIAEQQREGEALLHIGAAAFDRGDAGQARQLLTSAVESGTGGEEALALLGRLDRLEHARPQQRRAPRRPSVPEPGEPAAAIGPVPGTASRAIWAAVGVAAGLAVAAVTASLWLHNPEWLPATPDSAAASSRVEPLPVPPASEVFLLRARAMRDASRPHDALDLLRRVGAGDPLRAEADQLRAAIQSQLLESSRRHATPADPATGTPDR